MLRGMSVLPDPAELCAMADRIAGHASAARNRAARLDAAVGALGWHGAAAAACLAQVQVCTGGLRAAGDRLDASAGALRRHAERVSELLADASRLGADGAALFDDLLGDPAQVLPDAGRLLGDGLNVLGDALGVLGL